MLKNKVQTVKHTPTPWQVDKLRSCGGAPVITANTCWMGNTREVAKVLYHGGSEDREVDANAAHIVRCVNAHEELVKALEKADAILEAVYAQYPVPEIKQALAHAKGESHD